jgi:phosphinothricin acetyltransferase
MIRAAAVGDIPRMRDIFNDVIAHSTAVYMDDPVSLENRLSWFEGRRKQGFPVLVAVEAEEVLGFSSYGDFRGSPGYRHTVEHSVHIRADQRGKGIGSQLVQALIPIAVAQGKHVMIGGVDSENLGSIRFHERLGFRQVARFEEVGFKFGRWLDLVFLQRKLNGPS